MFSGWEALEYSGVLRKGFPGGLEDKSSSSFPCHYHPAWALDYDGVQDKGTQKRSLLLPLAQNLWCKFLRPLAAPCTVVPNVSGTCVYRRFPERRHSGGY